MLISGGNSKYGANLNFGAVLSNLGVTPQTGMAPPLCVCVCGGGGVTPKIDLKLAKIRHRFAY